MNSSSSPSSSSSNTSWASVVKKNLTRTFTYTYEDYDDGLYRRREKVVTLSTADVYSTDLSLGLVDYIRQRIRADKVDAPDAIRIHNGSGEDRTFEEISIEQVMTKLNSIPMSHGISFDSKLGCRIVGHFPCDKRNGYQDFPELLDLPEDAECVCFFRHTPLEYGEDLEEYHQRNRDAIIKIRTIPPPTYWWETKESDLQPGET